MFAHGPAAAASGDEAWLRAMLDVETALARAWAQRGVIPTDAAQRIAAVCAGDFDADAIGRAAAGGGNPVIPLVAELRARLDAESAAHVHRGATSQDILDTAAVLVARRSAALALEDADAVALACRRLSERHADTPMLARTLLQPALAISFALKAASWLSGVVGARAELARAVELLPLQLGGPVGRMDAPGASADGLAEATAELLALPAPVLPWHSNRLPIARLGGAMALLCGAIGKVALDVCLLAQGEVGELREATGVGEGGSSSMAHKHNPVAAIAALACARRMPGLAATLQAAMLAEHERAAGAWQSEWETLRDGLRLTGSTLAWGRTMLERVELDPRRMRENLRQAAAREGFDESAGRADALAERALRRIAEADR